MGVGSYSTTPASNTLINGINIGEGCAPSGINDAIRQLMADIATYITTGAMQIIAAAGTADVITATYAPAIGALTDGLLCAFVATAANATTTPTFNANGLGAKTITKKGGQPLFPGDIAGALAVHILEYNLANTRWELLNPATTFDPWVVAGGTADALTATYAPAIPALYDGLFLSVRATAANATTTPTLNVNGLGAKTITKRGGTALVAGEIAGNLYECLFVYNLANTRWELLNPAPVTLVVGTNTIDHASTAFVQTQLAAAFVANSGTTGTTQAINDNSTKLATTAYADRAGLGGTSQAWSDVTASRAFSTDYTNSTGRPIAVCLTHTQVAAGYVNPIVGGVVFGNSAASSIGEIVMITFIVQAGLTYRINGTNTKTTWMELR